MNVSDPSIIGLIVTIHLIVFFIFIAKLGHDVQRIWAKLEEIERKIH